MSKPENDALDLSFLFDQKTLPCPTHLTRVRLLARMNQNVSAQVRNLDKACRACFAFVRFLAGVNAQVGFQIGWTIELGIANWTLVWFVA